MPIAVLFSLAVWRELPYVYHADEWRTYNTTVGMLDRGSFDPEFFRYPTLMFYLHALVLAPFEWFGDVEYMQRISLGSAYAPSPGLVALLRAVTVVFALGAVALAMSISRRVSGSSVAAWTTAALLGVSPMVIEHSRYLATDTYAAMLSSATVAAAIVVFRRGNLRDYLIAGALAGLAGGAKYNAVLVALTIVVAHGLRQPSQVDSDTPVGGAAEVAARPKPISVQGFASLAASGAAAIVAFIVSTPYAVLSTDRWWDDVSFEMRHYSTGHLGTGESSVFHYVGLLWDTYAVVLLIAAVPLIVRRTRREAAIVASFVVGYVGFVSRYPLRFDRTILPILPALAALVGIAVALGWDALGRRDAPGTSEPSTVVAGASRRARWLRLALVVAVAAAFAVPYDGWESARPAGDGRSEAREWIADNLEPGSRILVSNYAPWVDPEDYAVEAIPRRGISTDEAAGFDYLVLAREEYGRFCRNPKRFAAELARWEALASSFSTAAEFDTPSRYVVLATSAAAQPSPPLCASDASSE